MGKDIFGYNRNPKPNGVFSSSESTLTFGTSGTAKSSIDNLIGYLVQNWRVGYRQDIREIFELGSDEVYWIRGRPTGDGSLGRIVGFKSIKIFPDEAWDMCSGGSTMVIAASPGFCNIEGKQVQRAGTKVEITLGGVIVVNIGFNATVADTRIDESVDIRFSTLELEEKSAA